MDAEAQRMVTLTEEQFALLDVLSLQRRAAVFGCAGTGKTMLACERARRLGAEGFRVLLTCFNGFLAEHLRGHGHVPTGAELLRDGRTPAAGNRLPPSVSVINFHMLCRLLGEQAGLSIDRPADLTESEWYDRRLPETLLEAGSRLGPQYDAVIVDEGQDFEPTFWEPLQLLLEDPEQGVFYVFFDDNQNLYERAPSVPAELPRYPLHRNLRNTRRIHQAFAPFYRGGEGVAPQAAGPEGRPVQLAYYESERELRWALQRALHELHESHVAASDVVVLTPHRKRGLVAECPKLGNFQLVNRASRAPHEVHCTTIHRFKGLESRVVILAGVEPSSYLPLETLLYVGCSRARHHLLILASAGLPPAMQTRLTAAVRRAA